MIDILSILSISIALVSIIINIILFLKVLQLKEELSKIKSSTKLTREEVQKLNERIGKIKSRAN